MSAPGFTGAGSLDGQVARFNLTGGVQADIFLKHSGAGAARTGGAGHTTVASLPHDGLALDLAGRRADALEAAAADTPTRHCDECGTGIAGPGMVASLGLACDVDCYDAMADRPGRYAQRNGNAR